MEGYRIGIDKKISDIDLNDVRSLIIPGGNMSSMKNDLIYGIFQKAKDLKIVIGGICAGVDKLEDSGILNGIQSTHSTTLDCVADNNIITSRANGYVDFAIQMAKVLHLFKDEQDLQETIAFWKYHQRMQ